MGLPPLLLDRLPPLLIPDPDPAPVILDAMHEPLTRARLLAHVIDRLLVPRKVEPPQQLGRRDPQVALREVNAGADAATGAVAEMVAVIAVFGGGVDRRQGRVVGVAGGVELGGVVPAGGVVVEGPDVEDDGGVFG